MESSLARQLQQAWLETQVRKQNSDFSSSSSNHGPVSSSSSSWSMSPDPGAEASFVSVSSVQPQSLEEEEPLHDPVLQYISNMLMDEDLEDRKCMFAECISYVKGLYDILGSKEAPPSTDYGAGPVEDDSFKDSACKEEPFSVIEGDAYQGSSFVNFSAYNDDVNHGVMPSGLALHEAFALNDGYSEVDVSAHATELMKSVVKTEHHLRIPPIEEEKVLNSSGEEHNWVDDLLSNMDAIVSQQDAFASVVPSPAFSSTAYPQLSESDSSYLSSQHSFGGTSIYEQEPLLNLDSFSPSSVLTDSATLNIHSKNQNIQHVRSGDGLHSFNTGSIEREMKSSHGRDLSYRRSASDTSETIPTSKTLTSTNSRFKRSATELDDAIVYQSISSFSPASSKVTLDAMGEESLSFVQNEHLNAEKCASVLNDGLDSVNGMCCKSSLPSVRQDVGRTSIIVSTVADLKGLLISCAQAVSSNNLRRAQEILQEIRQDASPYGSGLQRLAHYFAEGLVARLSGTGDRLYSVFTNNSPSAAKMLKAHQLFVEVCPFVKVSHYFANRAIMEAAKGASRLHIVDYGILYGLQWPSLISALAERKGGPPTLRITGIDFPQPGYSHAERVEMTGRRLAEYAKTYGVPFEYHAVANRWEVVQWSSLSLKQDEVVIVNSMHRLHHLLDETVLASNPRKTVLSKIKEMNPKMFVQGIKNGNYNAPFFMSRFKEALASFSGAFDMLETLISADNQERMMIEREVLGRDILNVVACEGPERVERPETYKQWQNRTQRAGFVQIPLDRKIVHESQTMVRCKYNKNFGLDEDGSWMLLSWKGKVVHGLSLWKPARH